VSQKCPRNAHSSRRVLAVARQPLVPSLSVEEREENRGYLEVVTERIIATPT